MEQFVGIAYDPEAGTISGRKGFVKHGYLYFTVNGKQYRAHRVAWFLTYGYWPVRLDHRNRNRLDNRLCNLREATKEQNAQNRGFDSKYLSKCVYYDPSKKSPRKYRVRVQVNGKRHHIGWYLTEENARREGERAVRRLHGEFAATSLAKRVS